MEDHPKRCFDVAVAAVGLAVGAPVLTVIAITIAITSPGPVIFRQLRVGRYGQCFPIHKFRTMRVGTIGPLVTATGDARVTPVGAFLRRTKLDELPQLFDVVAGQMSLVGPRPEVPHYVDCWPSDARAEILSVRPGITDPVSLRLRRESDELEKAADPGVHYVEVLLPIKVAGYVDYVQNRSFVGDLQILMTTILALLHGESRPADGLSDNQALHLWQDRRRTRGAPHSNEG